MSDTPPNIVEWRSRVIDERKANEEQYEKVSEKTRSLAFGVLAFAWVLLSADKGLPVTIANNHRTWILFTAGIAVISLFFDVVLALLTFVLRTYTYTDAVMSEQPQLPPQRLALSVGLTFGMMLVASIGSCASLILLMVIALLQH